MLPQRKYVCVLPAILFATATDELSFSWRRDHALPPPFSQYALPDLGVFRHTEKYFLGTFVLLSITFDKRRNYFSPDAVLPPFEEDVTRAILVF